MLDCDRSDWSPSKGHLSELYGMAIDMVLEVVHGVNWTFEVRGEHVFFLRLYRAEGRTLSEIQFELSALLHARRLEGSQFSTSQPVLTRHGKYLHELQTPEGPRTACLFTAARGRPFEDTEEDAAIFGQALSRLHGAMAGFSGQPARRFDALAIVDGARNALLAMGPQFYPLVSAFEGDVALWHLRSSIGHEFCHGDARMGNAHLDGEKVAFFDFDDCAMGPRAFDLSTNAWWLWRTDRENASGVWQAFMNGYTKIRPLSGDELKMLPSLIVLNEVRALYFLARYRLLSSELWIKHSEGAIRFFEEWRSGEAAAKMVLAG